MFSKIKGVGRPGVWEITLFSVLKYMIICAFENLPSIPSFLKNIILNILKI
jgi:hypothetical protein